MIQHGDSVQLVQTIHDGQWWFVITRGPLKINHGPFETKKKAIDVMHHLNVKKCSCEACVKRGEAS